MKKQLTIIIILGMLFLPLVSGFFPLSHKMMQDNLLETYQGDSEFYQACLKNPDACYVGNVLTDLSVAWYYVNGGENYVITHSPSFARAMLKNAVGEVEEACAIGSALHASQDYEAHNVMVPGAITSTGIPNSVIHVFTEQKVDNWVVEHYPEVKSELNLLTNESWNKCIPLIKKTLRGFSEYDDEFESGKLELVIDTFVEEVQKSVIPDRTGYDISFENKASVFGRLSFIPLYILVIYLAFMFFFGFLAILLIFKKNKGVLNYLSILLFGIIGVGMIVFLILSMTGSAFSSFVFLIKPISNLVPISNVDGHINQAIENGYSLFDEGEAWLIARESPDASGFETLHKADEEAKLMGYLLLTIAVSLLVLLIYLNFRKRNI